MAKKPTTTSAEVTRLLVDVAEGIGPCDEGCIQSSPDACLVCRCWDLRARLVQARHTKKVNNG